MEEIMKNNKIYLTVFLLAFIVLGIGGVLIYSNNISSVKSDSMKPTPTPTQKSQFRYLFGDFSGDHANYTFQTPPEEKIYADDCIGCKQEVGNLVIFAEFGCPNQSQYLFKSNSDGGVIEKSVKLDENGKEVGEKRLVVLKDNNGDIIQSRIFWIENNKDFWAILAPTIESAKAFEKSKEYVEVRKKVAKEKESYVPIQNANTERIKVLKEKECNEK